jgi:hypothetical protein
MVGNAVSTMWKGNLFCDMIDKRVKEAHNTAVEASTVDVPLKIVFKVDNVCVDVCKTMWDAADSSSTYLETTISC